MKSGGRFQFTPLHGLKQGPTQRGVSPCRSVVFDEIQFWSGNDYACKNRPENFIKGECFSKCLKKRCHRSLGRNKISIH